MDTVTKTHYMKFVCADDKHDLKVETEREGYRKSVCKKCGCIIEDEWETGDSKRVTVEGATNALMDRIESGFNRIFQMYKRGGK